MDSAFLDHNGTDIIEKKSFTSKLLFVLTHAMVQQLLMQGPNGKKSRVESVDCS